MFVTPLADITCMEDETVTFKCEINKTGCSAVWKKDGRPLPNEPRFEIKVQGTEHFLTIRDVILDDESDFTVSIEDAVSTAGLFVEEEIVEIITPLKDVILTSVPQDVHYVCEANKPALSHKWIVNGKPLPEEDRFKTKTVGNKYLLDIKKATERDDGEYTIVIKGKKSSAELIIEIPPQVKLDKKYSSQIVLKAGQMTIFEVPFSGWPTPTVTWSFNGQPLVTDKRIQEETISGISCIHVKNSQRVDTGIYSVEIVNDLGTVSAEIDLLVVDKPQPPCNLTVPETTEDAATLTWEAPDDDGGRPITHYTVEKRDVNRRSWSSVGESVDTKFTVPNLIEGQGYMFQVKAVNEVGPSEPAETDQPTKPVSKHSKLTMLVVVLVFATMYSNDSVISQDVLPVHYFLSCFHFSCLNKMAVT